MKKLILTIIMSLFLAIHCVMPALAATPTYGNFEYRDNGDDITITTYFGQEETVEVPAFIENKPVHEIADYAFYLCNTVKNIKVPESVVTIGKDAFTGANNLVEVKIVSDQVTEPEQPDVGTTDKPGSVDSGTTSETTTKPTDTSPQEEIEQAFDDEAIVTAGSLASDLEVDEYETLTEVDRQSNTEVQQSEKTEFTQNRTVFIKIVAILGVIIILLIGIFIVLKNKRKY